MKSSPNSVHGKRNYCAIGNSKTVGAEEGTRTPTPLRVHGPEPCASANSATSARTLCPARMAGLAAILVLQRVSSVSNLAGVNLCISAVASQPLLCASHQSQNLDLKNPTKEHAV